MNTIRYEITENKIAIVTISRPEALNALNTQVIAELEQTVEMIEKNSDLSAMILTGEGRSFVAGADIGEQYPLDLSRGREWGTAGKRRNAAHREACDTDHSRRKRLRIRRRLRDCHGLRYNIGFRKSKIRTA